ncbi:MAG TPA: hypothetical protein VFO01_18635 [Trebonia sp.]|nr:hypothetical protein [Trebonia sp.]
MYQILHGELSQHIFAGVVLAAAAAAVTLALTGQARFAQHLRHDRPVLINR